MSFAAVLLAESPGLEAPPVLPSWADCAEEYRRLYHEVAA